MQFSIISPKKDLKGLKRSSTGVSYKIEGFFFKNCIEMETKIEFFSYIGFFSHKPDVKETTSF